jgi:hypothetical protein
MRNLLVSFLLSGIVLCSNLAYAQSYAESALVFSRLKPTGTARIQSMGGAQTALGGDISMAFSNPAGLGMYNRSEVSITPLYKNYSYRNEFLGGNFEDDKTLFTVGSLGIALHSPAAKSGNFQGGTFAVTFNRINDFNEEYIYSGTNPSTSIIDFFIESANGAPESQFNQGNPQYNTLTGLAYYNYLIGPETILDPSGDPNFYFTDVLGIPFQTESAQIRGSSNTWNIAYGGNYNDMIYFGGGIGISSFRYKSEKVFRERFDDSEPLTDLSIVEALDLRGSGINFNLGLIVRPINYFQLGVSFTSPTMYNVEDFYEATMRTNWKNFEYLPGEFINNESASTDLLISEYNLNTPTRLSAGATFFLNKYGFITADVEMVNYGKAKYSSSFFGVSFAGDNEQIMQTFAKTYNIRIGAEGRYDVFRFRAGYAHLPDPLRNPGNFDRSINNISLGAGLKQKNFGLDFAYIRSVANNQYRPYILSDGAEPTVTQQFNTSTFMLTFGLTY